ncbi:SubName: Full=Uncharacterized protein {ECO:0000313/EMBL:CCA76101.1} [Serendipita indica DSM 11827]|uniref:Integrase catalytic domain-containing protein n=1 Tax=Serendipita indica (strain DSM 11827) TaxID=1109443 RepID=G4TXQ8_SERID|nr:SubName: Full=Uncharacterized protein {ECO:0000313/EMBL:CCA76101.1} [Serendipita indica DSM 11827]CCA76101.1 hypothetical protein PIIN_10101 [Serendipita indica DSM 11827]
MVEPGGQARAEALMAAYIDLCNQIRVAYLTQQQDIMVLRAREASTLRLQQAHRQFIHQDDLDYLLENLDYLLRSLHTKIATIVDQPDIAPARVLTHIAGTGQRGRPRIEIQCEFLVAATELRRPADIAPVVNVSTRTVRRRQLEAGVRQPGLPVSIQRADDTGQRVTMYPGHRSQSQLELTDQNLDELMREGLTLFPAFGQQMQDGFLRSRGFRVPRERIRSAFLRVNGAPAEFGRRRIERRKYNVAGPNSLWHHDGHHKLIRYKFITHAFVDGYSRMVVGIHVVTDNHATTVLSLFESVVDCFGRPRRVRGDYGIENVEVARNQEAARMRLVSGRRGRPSPADLFLFGMIEHGTRGLNEDHRNLEEEHHNLDEDYLENPAEYGVDWDDLEGIYARHRLQGDEEIRLEGSFEEVQVPANVFLRAPPPRFARVIVEPHKRLLLEQSRFRS